MEVIKQIQTELARHLAAGQTSPFQPSLKLSTELSALAREIEQKRRQGTLTPEERKLARAIDELWENIARANANLKNQEETKPLPVVIPRISSDEAERIIRGINEQLQRQEQPHAAPGVGDFALRGVAASPGRSLAEYLSAIKAEPPAAPFSDPDSQFDLTKLAKLKQDG